MEQFRCGVEESIQLGQFDTADDKDERDMHMPRAVPGLTEPCIVTKAEIEMHLMATIEERKISLWLCSLFCCFVRSKHRKVALMFPAPVINPHIFTMHSSLETVTVLN